MGHDVSLSNRAYINPQGMHESIFHGSGWYSIRINFCPPGTSIKVQFVNVIRAKCPDSSPFYALSRRIRLVTSLRKSQFERTIPFPIGRSILFVLTSIDRITF